MCNRPCMENEFYNIIELFKKSFGESLSSEERERLEHLLKNERLRDLWHELERGDLVREGVQNEEFFSSQRGFAEFKRRRKVNKYRKLRLYLTLGVSAAVVVLVMNMVFTWLPSLKKNVERGLLTTTPDIFFERNDVRLLLSTGDTVVIAGENKEFEDKGGTQIKYDKGELAYSSREEEKEVVYNVLLVPVGGECFVMLEDSTRVWLNADSKLKYPTCFAGNERRVELEGEAYFDVKPDDKPFIVNTSVGDIKVLGTSFNVRVYAQENMQTTLVTGKVLYRGQDSVVLMPGEQVVAFLTGGFEKRTVDVDEYVAWKNGMYMFDCRPLEEIMRDLERWYGITVEFMTPELRQLPFTGCVKRYEKMNAFLELLKSTGELKYKIRGKSIMLYKE